MNASAASSSVPGRTLCKWTEPHDIDEGRSSNFLAVSVIETEEKPELNLIRMRPDAYVSFFPISLGDRGLPEQEDSNESRRMRQREIRTARFREEVTIEVQQRSAE